MKYKKLQKNKACPEKLKRSSGLALYEAKGFRSGFVLLFAVVLSAIILAIALGVANIALKEMKFSTSAKDTNYAFFAADTGIECALFNDKPPTAFSLPPESKALACAGGAIPLFASDGAGGGTFTFSVVSLGDAGVSCSNISVTKTKSDANILTTVVAKGYNIGKNDSPCTSDNPDRIEREIKVNY